MKRETIEMVNEWVRSLQDRSGYGSTENINEELIGLEEDGENIYIKVKVPKKTEKPLGKRSTP
jgi:hypothetical protein